MEIIEKKIEDTEGKREKQDGKYAFPQQLCQLALKPLFLFRVLEISSAGFCL